MNDSKQPTAADTQSETVPAHSMAPVRIENTVPKTVFKVLLQNP